MVQSDSASSLNSANSTSGKRSPSAKVSVMLKRDEDVPVVST